MRRLISREEAVDATCQHEKACSDCPWSRRSLNGWLGGASIDDWIGAAHSDTYIDCHTLRGVQCAGVAIYRRNVCKRVDPPLLTLPADRETVFANPMEFCEHHSRMPS